MASDTPLALNTTAAAFAAAWAAHLAPKVNANASMGAEDAGSHAVAEWGDLVDDFMVSAQDATRLLYRGNGSPEGAVVAPVGSLYHREDGSAGTTLYTKESGTGSSGWVAMTSSSSANSDVYYDLDWSELADNALADGSEVIDGLSWTAVNMALLGTREVDLGAGLRFSAGAGLGSVSTFTSSAQSTPHIYLPLESIPDFDPRYDLIIEAYLSGFTAENSGEGFFMGLWGPTGVPSSTSAARVRWAGLFNSGGSRVLRSTSQTTAVSTDDTRTTHNVIGMRITPNGIGHTWSGVYAAGFPTLIVPGTTFPTLVADDDPFTAAGCRFFISAATVNDASPTSTYVLERLVFRRAG